MSRQTNFKKISIVLGVLLVLLLVLKLKDKKEGDRSFKAFVMAVDTSVVNQIAIIPKGTQQKVRFTKEDDLWMLNINNKQVQADAEIINGLLSQVCSLKTKSVAATSEQKWNDYEVTDSLGTRITINAGNKELVDFMLGKFSYSQPQGQNQYRQQNIQMTSYLRLMDENEVYAVDGYLSMMFNRGVNSFRDNKVIMGDPKKWKKLIFTYPADSSFALINQNDKWMVNGMIADSAKTASYLSEISRLSNNLFDDETVIEASQQPEFSLRIEGDNTVTIEIKAYRLNDGELVYVSSQNKGNILKSQSIRESLFINNRQFLIN